MDLFNIKESKGNDSWNKGYPDKIHVYNHTMVIYTHYKCNEILSIAY